MYIDIMFGNLRNLFILMKGSKDSVSHFGIVSGTATLKQL